MQDSRKLKAIIPVPGSLVSDVLCGEKKSLASKKKGQNHEPTNLKNMF